MACLLAMATSVFSSAQIADRTQSPVLQPGEGLTKSKKDVESMRNDKQDKKARITDVYVCAFSFSLVDSIMYMSNIYKIEKATVRNKWFLENRADLEQKFEEYVRGRAGGDLQLSSLFFSEKEKKVLKERERIIKKNRKKNKFKVQYTGADFRF